MQTAFAFINCSHKKCSLDVLEMFLSFSDGNENMFSLTHMDPVLGNKGQVCGSFQQKYNA